MTDNRKVKVSCSFVNGLDLRVSTAGHDDGTGKSMLSSGPYVHINGPSALNTGAGNTRVFESAITEVDADFMERWMAQNEFNPLVTQGMVVVLHGDQIDAADVEASAPETSAADDIQPEDGEQQEKVIHVDPETGDDSNNGETPETAVQTIQAAVDKTDSSIDADIDPPAPASEPEPEPQVEPQPEPESKPDADAATLDHVEKALEQNQ